MRSFPLLDRSRSWVVPCFLSAFSLALPCSAQSPNPPDAYNLKATGGTAYRVTGSGTTNDTPPDAIGTINADRSSKLGYSYGQPATYYNYSIPVSSNCAGTVTSSGAWANPTGPPPPATLVKQVVTVGWSGTTGTTGDRDINGDLANQPGSGIVSTTQSYTITARRAINQPGQSLTIASFQPTADAYLKVGPGGTAAANVSYDLSAFPFAIASPKPSGHPEKGDGTNQFVYDAQQPDGFLALPALVSVPGALVEDTTWMLPHVALSVSPAISPDALLSTWTSAPGVLYPLTVGNYPNGNTYPTMSYIYKGLPAQNTIFGDHQMIMKVDSSQSQTANFQQSQVANFQTFFGATASNYPNATTDATTNGFPTPDWYFYYNEVYTATGKYRVGNQTSTDFSSPWAIHIDDQTYGTIGGTHIYALKSAADKISWAGDIELSGIWNYIFTCAHEKEHQDACTDGTYSSDGSSLTLTSDNDRLDNIWEDGHYFNSKSPNTTGAPAYGNETDAPDDEAIADIVGLGKLLSVIDDWKQDWAGVPSGGGYAGALRFGTSHLAIKPSDT